MIPSELSHRATCLPSWSIASIAVSAAGADDDRRMRRDLGPRAPDRQGRHVLVGIAPLRPGHPCGQSVIVSAGAARRPPARRPSLVIDATQADDQSEKLATMYARTCFSSRCSPRRRASPGAFASLSTTIGNSLTAAMAGVKGPDPPVLGPGVTNPVVELPKRQLRTRFAPTTAFCKVFFDIKLDCELCTWYMSCITSGVFIVGRSYAVRGGLRFVPGGRGPADLSDNEGDPTWRRSWPTKRRPARSWPAG